jgi:hypothetical protein
MCIFTSTSLTLLYMESLHQHCSQPQRSVRSLSWQQNITFSVLKRKFRASSLTQHLAANRARNFIFTFHFADIHSSGLSTIDQGWSRCWGRLRPSPAIYIHSSGFSFASNGLQIIRELQSDHITRKLNIK